MPDPQILKLLGVEVQIELWRGTDNLFDAFLTDATGTPVSLATKNVTMTIVDRPGGAVMFTQTKTPATHTDAAGGLTRFSVPAEVTIALLERRSYTWKHVVTAEDTITGDVHPFFYGDVRVLTLATWHALSLRGRPADELGVADVLVAVLV